MTATVKLSLFTLMLMISFASVNAVLFTPALPDMVRFFNITNSSGQLTVTWFLIGYTFGQLVYGPLANRFGRKPTLYLGICLQVLTSLLCVVAGKMDNFLLLVVGRFLVGLGSGVGLKMAFTLISEFYEPKIASQKTAYTLLAFAIAPGIAIAVGGVLNHYFGWMSCFYAGALYGGCLLFLSTKLPETLKTLDLNALKPKHLIQEYKLQFLDTKLIAGGLLMGSCTSIVYIFAALAPFVAINLYNLSSVEYGLANVLPPVGMILGFFFSAYLVRTHTLSFAIRVGIIISSFGVALMLLNMLIHLPVILALFAPMIIIYFGASVIIANGSTVGMAHVEDKSHASAVMNFINMGLATIAVLTIGNFQISKLLLPISYIVISIALYLVYIWKIKPVKVEAKIAD